MPSLTHASTIFSSDRPRYLHRSRVFSFVLDLFCSLVSRSLSPEKEVIQRERRACIDQVESKRKIRELD